MTDYSDSGIEFLTHFGMAIAYDNLGLSAECKFSLESMQCLMDADCGDCDLPRYGNEEYDMSEQLKSLAEMGLSKNVKEVLLSFISEIYSSDVRTLSSNKKVFIKSQVRIYNCKSLWKKFEKLCHNIERTLKKIANIINQFLDIKDRVVNENQNVNQSDFKSLSKSVDELTLV